MNEQRFLGGMCMVAQSLGALNAKYHACCHELVIQKSEIIGLDELE